MCFTSQCVLGGCQIFVRGFWVILIWQRKLPSESGSKRLTCQSVQLCIGSEILNCVRMCKSVGVGVLYVYESSLLTTLLQLPCACCLLTNLPVLFYCAS